MFRKVKYKKSSNLHNLCLLIIKIVLKIICSWILLFLLMAYLKFMSIGLIQSIWLKLILLSKLVRSITGIIKYNYLLISRKKTMDKLLGTVLLWIVRRQARKWLSWWIRVKCSDRYTLMGLLIQYTHYRTLVWRNGSYNQTKPQLYTHAHRT